MAIPNVRGKSPEAAKATLEDAGFSVARNTRTSNNPAGTYLGASQTGTAPKGSTIYLVYSSGPVRSAPHRPPPPSRSRTSQNHQRFRSRPTRRNSRNDWMSRC